MQKYMEMEIVWTTYAVRQIKHKKYMDADAHVILLFNSANVFTFNQNLQNSNPFFVVGLFFIFLQMCTKTQRHMFYTFFSFITVD